MKIAFLIAAILATFSVASTPAFAGCGGPIDPWPFPWAKCSAGYIRAYSTAAPYSPICTPVKKKIMKAKHK
jgi:hypothetical protein